MTQQFTLDTSGEIFCARKPAQVISNFVRWHDLSPFAQGYVEALFSVMGHSQEEADGRITRVPLAFSDLHPEALAMILRDCEAYRQAAGMVGILNCAEQGAHFWNARQRPGKGRRQGGVSDGAGYHGLDERSTHYPPLRVYLDDAGKVRLEVRQ